MFDGEAFGQQIVEIVRGYVAAQIDPVLAENSVLRARLDAVEAVPAPRDGEPGKDGADVDMAEVERMLDEKFAAAMAAVPPAEPGKDGKDGTDVDMAAVKQLIAEEIGAAVSALPPAEKGDSGKDGVGLADALIDRDGRLVLTLTDGGTKALGQVVGRDGKDGDDGAPGHTFGLDDFEIVPMDERTIKMGFTFGEVMHSFELAIPTVIYRGLWKQGETYQRGDMVTWAGGVWHCNADDCQSKPDAGEYTLAVKRGRDGRDAGK